MTSTEAHHSAIGEEASSRRARAAGAGVNFLLKEKDLYATEEGRAER